MIKKYKHVYLVLLCLVTFLTQAQQLVKVNQDFLKHLMVQELEHERLSYYNCIDFNSLSTLSISKDLVYLSAKYKDTLLLKRYSYYAKDTIELMHVFYGSILLHQIKIVDHSIEALRDQSLSKKNITQLAELKDCILGKFEKDNDESQFYTTKTRIKQLERKSLFLATLLSTLLPGSGKFYLMQNEEAIGAISLNLIALAPLIEISLKIGLLTTAGVLSGLVFLPIYFATLYGTYISKKALLKKLNLQLKNEVLDFCTYQLRNYY
jgi:TM2 domain-containing membrane protein YozV